MSFYCSVNVIIDIKITDSKTDEMSITYRTVVEPADNNALTALNIVLDKIVITTGVKKKEINVLAIRIKEVE